MGDIENINKIIVCSLHFNGRRRHRRCLSVRTSEQSGESNENASGELITFYVICYMTFDIFSLGCFEEQSVPNKSSCDYFFDSFVRFVLQLTQSGSSSYFSSCSQQISTREYPLWLVIHTRQKPKNKWKQCLLQILNCHHNMIQLKKDHVFIFACEVQ